MTENQDNKKIGYSGVNLLEITNEYIKNERLKNESENILNIAVEKLKRTLAEKVKDNDKHFNTEFDNERKKQGNLI